MIRGAFQILERTFDSGRSPLPNTFHWLQQSAPKFSINGDQVSVLHQPEDFYRTILKECKNAKERIMLASLYVGTGALEKKLVETIGTRLKEEIGLKVNILIDANRGSRGKVNSRQMLIPLLKKSDRQCQVSLFHTPLLRGPLKYILPQRYNELVGLQHMKLYLFDNSVLITGANLSEDYFTNRQDRYIMIKDCKPLADFYWGLVKRISSVSFALDKFDTITPRSFHPYKSDQQMYIREAREKIWSYYKSSVQHTETDPNHDTWIYPLLELPPLGVHQDSNMTKKLLESAEEGSVLTLSTGYFNLTEQYSDTIVNKSKGNFLIIMAHPTANGFLKASGLASGIPGAYTGLALRFLNIVSNNDQNHRISMCEYRRPDWTYHAKGLWYTLRDEHLPSLTLIGSSNFGSRSVRRDIENQIAIVTENQGLKARLKEEEESLKSFTTPFTIEVGLEPNRKPALWVLTTMILFKDFF
ncbi:CDP-diacylglycerol--glycerol-3-phosphate 3-phosphatidyltransferase, mitochondrial [Cimex lectularius]|uniref:CDP-diacylglycerol--glycerol-3-phosphate 3-phosphatidyltransferase n=1 Tax=Cimex lectularius TaxID=79782 RepID=A0A8I6RL16_CIMLE|nr:CDP-diacylglycerol--glycerol-3-phosphate 3-phosphatidyltransferase, mitochondrial [Cimex lectularius]